MREIVTRVGMHFNVTRCAYGEVDVDQGQLLVARGYTRDLPTVAGRYPLDAFGSLMVGELKAGRVAVIDDVRTDPLTDRPDRRRPLTRGCRLSRWSRAAGARRQADRRAGDVRRRRRGSGREDDAATRAGGRTHAVCGRMRPRRAALRENRDVMQLAMSTAQMGAWTRDLVLDTVWWSPEFAAIFGVAPDDANYDRNAAVRAGQAGRPPAAAARYRRRRSATSRITPLEFEFQHAHDRRMALDGERAAGRNTPPTAGQLKLYGLVIDITERRRAVAALQEADRRKDEFLATLAHELRNPARADQLRASHPATSAQIRSQARPRSRSWSGRSARWCGWSTICSTWRASPPARWKCACEPIDLALAINDAIETSGRSRTGGQPFDACTCPRHRYS